MTATRKHLTLIALTGLLAALAVNPAKADVKVHIGLGLDSFGYYDRYDGHNPYYNQYHRPKYKSRYYHQKRSHYYQSKKRYHRPKHHYRAYKHHNRPHKYRTPRHHQRHDRGGRHHRWSSAGLKYKSRNMLIACSGFFNDIRVN